MEIQELHQDSRIDEFFIHRWGGDFIVSGSERLYGHDLDGFVVLDGKVIIGLLTYHLKNSECEIVSLDSVRVKQGIGSALIKSMIKKAKEMKVNRLWLMTTNDNIEAQEFYKKRGFFVKEIHKGAIQKSRDLGENIPLVSKNGTPICDEIELEYSFD